MLVLTRKPNECIQIDNNITITVVDVTGNKVRLGIVAPHEVAVHRQEVYDAIHGKEQHAGKPPPVPWSSTASHGQGSPAAARAEELDVRSREFILFEEDGTLSLLTVNGSATAGQP
jgi:carbon storage regulator